MNSGWIPSVIHRTESCESLAMAVDENGGPQLALEVGGPGRVRFGFYRKRWTRMSPSTAGLLGLDAAVAAQDPMRRIHAGGRLDAWIIEPFLADLPSAPASLVADLEDSSHDDL
jgi:hypothetical protein